MHFRLLIPNLRERSLRASALLIALILVFNLAFVAIIGGGLKFLQASPPTPVPNLETWMPDGAVYSMAIDGNTMYVGGSFRYIGPQTGSGVLVDRAARTRLSFPRFDAGVNDAVPDGSGGWYVAGCFNTVNQTDTNRRVVAHVESDGTIDASFNPAFEWGCPDAIALYGNVLYVAGGNMRLEGVSGLELIAIDATTGARLPWNPNPRYTLFSSDYAGEVTNLLVHNNRLYVAGNFHTIVGQPRRAIAAFDLTSNPDDPSLLPFAPSLHNSQSTSDTPIVNDMAATGTTLFLAGSFTSVNSVARDSLAGLDLSTTHGTVTSLDASISGAQYYEDVYASELSIYGDTLYMAGHVKSVGNVARDGSAAFRISTGELLPFNPALPYVSAIDADGTNVYISGYFGEGYNVPGIGEYVAVVDPVTGVETGWDFGANAQLSVITHDNNGRLFFGGATSIGGVVRQNAAAIDLTNGAATSWRADTDGTVNAIAVDAARDRIYLGGDFWEIEGVDMRYLAAVERSDGDLVASWDPNPDYEVTDLALSGNDLFVGGSFCKIGNTSLQYLCYLAKLNATTGNSVDSWNPDPDFNNWGTIRVNTIVVKGPNVYVGGNFDLIGNANGTRATRPYLAAVDRTTGSATAWNPDVDDEVEAIAISNNTLYAGGWFWSVNGGTSRKYLAAFDTRVNTNNNIASFAPPAFDDGISSLSVDAADGTLYVGGYFWEIGASSPHQKLAALDASTGSLIPWDINIDGWSTTDDVYVVKAAGGAVFAGGDVIFGAGIPDPVYSDPGDAYPTLWVEGLVQVGDYTYTPPAIPSLQFSPATGAGSEGASSPSVYVTLSNEYSSDTTFDYAVTGGTATAGSDFTLAAGTATVYAGDTAGAIPLSIINDSDVESPETVEITISNPTNGTLGSNTTYTYTINDNDSAGSSGVSVTQSGGTTSVTEGGATDSYSVVLNTAPASDVTISISSGSQVNLSTSSLVFTPANWDTPQTVTVTAVDDTSIEGAHTEFVTHSAQSADTEYDGVTVGAVGVAITDNDAAGSPGVTVSLSGSNTSVTEGGATDSYTVVLNSVPSSDVTISLSPGPQVTVSAPTLTFTSSDWDVPQTVTVTAVDDASIEGSHSDTVSHSSASSDGSYNGVSVGSVSVSIIDNDQPAPTTGEPAERRDRPNRKHSAMPSGTTGPSIPSENVAPSPKDKLKPADGFLVRDIKEGSKGSDVAVLNDFLAKNGFADASKHAEGKKTFDKETKNGIEDLKDKYERQYSGGEKKGGGDLDEKTKEFVNAVTAAGRLSCDAGIETSLVAPTGYFTKNLSKDKKEDGEVQMLQQFLNQNGYAVAATGPGSKGNENKSFGEGTKKALLKFQKDHWAELSVLGLKEPDGSLDFKTRTFINSVRADKTVECDDVSVQFTTTSEQAGEAAGGMGAEVALSAPCSSPVYVNFKSTDISAEEGYDYSRSSGRLVFLPGSIKKTVSSRLFDDSSVEGTENFRLALSSPKGAKLGSATENIHMILDNDVLPPPAPTTTPTTTPPVEPPPAPTSTPTTTPVEPPPVTEPAPEPPPPDIIGPIIIIVQRPGQITVPVMPEPQPEPYPYQPPTTEPGGTLPVIVPEEPTLVTYVTYDVTLVQEPTAPVIAVLDPEPGIVVNTESADGTTITFDPGDSDRTSTVEVAIISADDGIADEGGAIEIVLASEDLAFDGADVDPIIIGSEPETPSAPTVVPEPVAEPVAEPATTTPVELPALGEPATSTQVLPEIALAESSHGGSGGSRRAPGEPGESDGSFLARVAQSVADAASQARLFMVEAFENIQREALPATAAVALTSMVAAAYGAVAAQFAKGVKSFDDLRALITRSVMELLGLFGIKKKRKVWGTVYDSVTKLPIDPVIVSLIDLDTGRVVEEAVTDLAGRYGFLVRKGTFMIYAQRTNYLFPSKKEPGKTDEIYENLYHGETIVINGETDVVAPNIPMDPFAYDWNQATKPQRLHFHPRLRFLAGLAAAALYWTGFLWTAYACFKTPSATNFSLLGAYVAVYLITLFWPAPRLWGRIYGSRGHEDVSGFVIELATAASDMQVVMGRARPGPDGKFFLKANPGKYELRVVDKSEDQSKVVYENAVEVGKEGLWNRDISL